MAVAKNLPLFLLFQIMGMAFAQNQVIQVGYQGLQFGPNTVYASVGSKIEFQFVQPDHDVVEGAYDTPCLPASGSAFYSGANVDTVSLCIAFFIVHAY
jgi:plastocyanin